MLPTMYHPQDAKWLEERFDELTRHGGINRAKAIAEKYAIAYQDTFENTEEKHKKHNKARHDANQRLVKVIKSLTQKAHQPYA